MKLVPQSEYPYKAKTGICHFFPQSHDGVAVRNFTSHDFRSTTLSVSDTNGAIFGRNRTGFLICFHKVPRTGVRGVDPAQWERTRGVVLEQHGGSSLRSHWPAQSDLEWRWRQTLFNIQPDRDSHSCACNARYGTLRHYHREESGSCHED